MFVTPILDRFELVVGISRDVLGCPADCTRRVLVVEWVGAVVRSELFPKALAALLNERFDLAGIRRQPAR